MDLSLLSARTVVSDGLMYHVCHLKFPNLLMSRLYTSNSEFILLQFVTGFSFLRVQMEALNKSENNSTEDE